MSQPRRFSPRIGWVFVAAFGLAASHAHALAQPGTGAGPVKVLIITGDHGHAWKETTGRLSEILGTGGKIKVDVTITPSKDLTDENLSKYDVLLLNYKDTPKGTPESRWSDANKQAFFKAVHDGKGLVVFHHASSAFTKPNWDEFEKAIAGGWRSQGFHGPKHVFTVKKTDAKHPISEGLAVGVRAHDRRAVPEFGDGARRAPFWRRPIQTPTRPKGTGKDEPVIWVNSYGKGRVYENVLGHDVEAMSDPQFQEWMRRGVIWAGTGKVD